MESVPGTPKDIEQLLEGSRVGLRRASWHGYDRRLEDPIGLMLRKRGQDGRWLLQNRRPGRTYFELEQVGKPSRWNTLRALRVLDWWGRVNEAG